jgi:hypothetical protein
MHHSLPMPVKATAQTVTFQMTTDTLTKAELEQLKHELSQIARLADEFSQLRNQVGRAV